MAQQVREEVTVRDFHIDDVPEEELVDLRQRIAETRWPERETVEDQSQGPRLAGDLPDQVRLAGLLRALVGLPLEPRGRLLVDVEPQAIEGVRALGGCGRYGQNYEQDGAERC